ncbi:hypothetical protein PMIN03_002939 [Paraphaeosphaeria minitans]
MTGRCDADIEFINDRVLRVADIKLVNNWALRIALVDGVNNRTLRIAHIKRLDDRTRWKSRSRNRSHPSEHGNKAEEKTSHLARSIERRVSDEVGVWISEMGKPLQEWVS